MTRQCPYGKTVRKDITRCSDYVCVYIDPPKSTKIEAESLKEGIISAVKFTKVFVVMVLDDDYYDVCILCVIFHRKG